MTHADALSKLRTHKPATDLGENFRQAGILALDDLERIVSDFFAKHPKAVPESLKINSRTPDEHRDLIVSMYCIDPSTESES